MPFLRCAFLLLLSSFLIFVLILRFCACSFVILINILYMWLGCLVPCGAAVRLSDCLTVRLSHCPAVPCNYPNLASLAVKGFWAWKIDNGIVDLNFIYGLGLRYKNGISYTPLSRAEAPIECCMLSGKRLTTSALSQFIIPVRYLDGFPICV